MIQSVKLQDDLRSVARLIYETDPIMSFLFGKNPKSIDRIHQLIQCRDNAFSHVNIEVYCEEGLIKGLILSYKPTNIDKKRENHVYSNIFSPLELITLWLKSIILKPIQNKKEVDGIYIQNISVDVAFRGEGIGSKLLSEIEKKAIIQNIDSLWLDVALDNEKAKRLYERIGFKIVSRHKLLFSKKGFFRMRKKLNT